MNKLQIEAHILKGDSLPHALATHILTSCLNGSVAVVCDKPTELMNRVKKEWRRLIHNQTSYYKDYISFSADPLSEDVQANIIFSTTREFKLLPPICRTLYITQDTDKQDMYMLTSWMPPHSSVILNKIQ